MPPLEELETSYGTCSFWRAIGCPASPPPLHPHHFSCSPRSSRSRAHQRLRHRCFSRMRRSSAAGTVSGSERRHRVHGAPRRLSESRRSCRRWRDHELVASHWVGAAWREVASFVAAREARRSGRCVAERLTPRAARMEDGRRSVCPQNAASHCIPDGLRALGRVRRATPGQYSALPPRRRSCACPST